MGRLEIGADESLPFGTGDMLLGALLHPVGEKCSDHCCRSGILGLHGIASANLFSKGMHDADHLLRQFVN